MKRRLCKPALALVVLIASFCSCRSDRDTRQSDVARRLNRELSVGDSERRAQEVLTEMGFEYRFDSLGRCYEGRLPDRFEGDILVKTSVTVELASDRTVSEFGVVEIRLSPEQVRSLSTLDRPSK